MSFSFSGGDEVDEVWELKLYNNGIHTNNPPNSSASLRTLYSNPRWTLMEDRESNASMTAIVDRSAANGVQTPAREVGSKTPVRIRRSYFSSFYLGD
ncbi:MAG: hypothetical protein CMP23_04280 [Rickettsiales bacterium]|nr:hypothetical protein [Rickettsiales bacterium]|tara:strand:+ start:784 stop:1074 length:291 start_codon:yes stop_codon:yes gene_type:complete